jgi:hypothetical protein
MNPIKEFHDLASTIKNDLQSKDWKETCLVIFGLIIFALLLFPVLIYTYILILIDFIQSLRGKR